MKHYEEAAQQNNLGYAVRLTMANPPRAPHEELEERIVKELNNPPHNYHVQATRYGDELAMLVYAQGRVESIVDHGANLAKTLDSYPEDILYGITPMIPLEPENTMTFGDKVRKLRRSKRTDTGKRYTQAEMASELDVVPSYVNKLENGKLSPSPAHIDKASELLGYDRTVLRCMAEKLPDEILKFISENPFWMTAIFKK
jgi:DNA-binding XRE family transcriptional regulator